MLRNKLKCLEYGLFVPAILLTSSFGSMYTFFQKCVEKVGKKNSILLAISPGPVRVCHCPHRSWASPKEMEQPFKLPCVITDVRSCLRHVCLSASSEVIPQILYIGLYSCALYVTTVGEKLGVIVSSLKMYRLIITVEITHKLYYLGYKPYKTI